MRSFGRSLERRGVRYLLISGQASILYGASTFSEDVDLWVEPTARNLARFLRALADRGARIYKLTPPVTARNAKHGHGFHFLLPSTSGPVYLDIMGRPPRVGRFPPCLRRAVPLRAAWGGTVPVIGIEDLVEVKKTRRLADYDAISRLVRIAIENAPAASPPLLAWALRNSFDAEGIAAFLTRFPGAPRIARAVRRPAVTALLARDVPAASRLERCRRRLSSEIAAWQRRDVRYWRPIIREIRMMWKAGELLSEGAPVRGGV